MLSTDIKDQLAEYLKLMENNVIITASVGTDDASKNMLEFLEEIVTMSSKINFRLEVLPRTPSFTIARTDFDAGIIFAGIPLGHEFNSFVLALLQISGRAPKIENQLMEQIKKLPGEHHFETYVSLSCHNCPDVVQALNVMSLLNSGITHTMIDGAIFKEEIEQKEIMGVPTIYRNGELFGNGRMTLEDLLAKIGVPSDISKFESKTPYDVLVIGGGPAGVSASIYAARKGIRTGIILDKFGGQVRDTLGIENFIGTKYIEGAKLSLNLQDHLEAYDVDIMKSQLVKQLVKKNYIEIELENGAVLQSRTVIICTGARWRSLGIPGEAKFKNKGVAYCPHCDGPFYKEKDVAVIGGGNSGIEATIDLAGIAKHVTVFEFLPELKADAVLIKRLSGLSNVTVLKNVETKEITGESKVESITYTDRSTGESAQLKLDGIFVQIGLVANTDWLGDTIKRNRLGEIVIDDHNATDIPGVFAAGDCTNSPYKQIIISMGSGANAALSAFDYLIRNY